MMVCLSPTPELHMPAVETEGQFSVEVVTGGGHERVRNEATVTWVKSSTVCGTDLPLVDLCVGFDAPCRD